MPTAGIVDENGNFVNQLQVYSLLLLSLLEVRGMRAGRQDGSQHDDGDKWEGV